MDYKNLDVHKIKEVFSIYVLRTAIIELYFFTYPISLFEIDKT